MELSFEGIKMCEVEYNTAVYDIVQHNPAKF